jgi:hypothetical protein
MQVERRLRDRNEQPMVRRYFWRLVVLVILATAFVYLALTRV